MLAAWHLLITLVCTGFMASASSPRQLQAT